MAYPFSPPVCQYDRFYAYWQGGFTNNDINRIVEIGEALPKEKAQIGSGAEGAELEEHRNSYVSWIGHNDETRTIYQKLSSYAIQLNQKYFGFDLFGFVEDLQYTVYDSSRGPEHYTWHIDAMGKNKSPRKLSIIVQLTNPMDYEGGEVWIQGATNDVLPKERGIMFAFPSYALHRVTPVTKGIRRSLVGWISGPEFR